MIVLLKQDEVPMEKDIVSVSENEWELNIEEFNI